ncbi:uncharacterized protein RAG0_13443 [Rhynchosporium agropyri]|uniref:Uncharacterized protein n=1 Tax=Rhynchosporium agropyri TaxID=914238 RepID=A0A1E1LCR9_9HELO|nr:uncharacterized protein RAG0_13443 [Rhynchosporium agropyri]
MASTGVVARHKMRRMSTKNSDMQDHESSAQYSHQWKIHGQ